MAIKQGRGMILITGGSGLVGSRLTEMLLKNGYAVRHLSTSFLPSRADKPHRRNDGVEVYGWDPAAGRMDLKAIDKVDFIVNLAGSSISSRWTTSHKQLIRDSRIDSLRTLYTALDTKPNSVKALISSSAVGFYPSGTDQPFEESDEPDNGFLGSVCQEWETEAKHFEQLGLHVAILRTGIVLSKKGGILPVVARMIRWFGGASLASGKQILPWIHIDDLCRMYLYAIESGLKGPYNAVGVRGASNREFTQAVARVLRRPFWPMKVPAFILQTVLGSQSQIVLMSTPCSNERIVADGFTYRYTDLDVALIDLLQQKKS